MRWGSLVAWGAVAFAIAGLFSFLSRVDLNAVRPPGHAEEYIRIEVHACHHPTTIRPRKYSFPAARLPNQYEYRRGKIPLRGRLCELPRTKRNRSHTGGSRNVPPRSGAQLRHSSGILRSRTLFDYRRRRPFHGNARLCRGRNERSDLESRGLPSLAPLKTASIRAAPAENPTAVTWTVEAFRPVVAQIRN